MRIVMDWLGEHVELPGDLTAEQLAADLVRVGLEEEAIHSLGIQGPLVVGRVVGLSPEAQKNGKTINWCQVDVGTHNVPDETGQPVAARGIVCGAHNFGPGDWVVVALPGAVLPGPFAISSRRTYGHLSDGMICSQRELGLGEDHDGIIVLTRMGYDGGELSPGQDAIALLGLDREIVEINVTPDRGYCFSYRGIAREYSHATGARFTDRGAESDGQHTSGSGGFAVEVEDNAPIHGVIGCDRFTTRIVRGIDPSARTPEYMVRRLEGAGMRPISLAVDITNYVMLDLGQPLHAYDLAQVAEPLVVRRAVPGERLTTLDGAERVLDTQDLLIADSPDGVRGARVLGLAGVMGGASSEVGEATTSVLIEAAHFDPITVARTARRHRLSSEAAKRFERGVDPLLTMVAATRVADLLVEYGGGRRDEDAGGFDHVAPRTSIEFCLTDPWSVAGFDAQVELPEFSDALLAVGCTIEPTDDHDTVVAVTPPSWRPDLTGPADLLEEIARLVGYHRIPSILPAFPPGRGLTAAQRARRSVARALAEAGWIETLTYPFTGAADLDALRLAQDDERRQAVRLANPITEERPLLRTSVLATLLDAARRNVGRGAADFALYEIGLITRLSDAPPPPVPSAGVLPSEHDLTALFEGVPDQPRHVAGIAVGKRVRDGWAGPGRPADWGDALAAVRLAAQRVGTTVSVVAETDYAPWHPGRCARIEVAGRVVGHAGELHPKVCESFGLPARAVAFELDLDAIIEAAPRDPVLVRPVRVLPVAKEDMAFVVANTVPAADVAAAIIAGGGEMLEDVHLFDVYCGPQVGEQHKSLAFAVRLRGERTLTAEDISAVRAGIVHEVQERVGGTLRA